MKKIDIPQTVYLAIRELGYKIRKKQNGDITFWNTPKHPMSIEFFDENRTSFRTKLWIGDLSDESELKAAQLCCIEINPQLYLVKLVIEKKRSKKGICAAIDYSCYSPRDVRKFIPMASELLIGCGVQCIDYMNEKVKTIKNAQ